MLGAALAVDNADLLAFLEEDALEADIGIDLHHVVVHEMSFADGPLVLVSVDDLLEVARRVGGRRGRQTDADGVEVIECIPPDR